MTLYTVLALIVLVLMAQWLYSLFIWERGYNCCSKDRDAYDARKEFGFESGLSSKELAERFLQSRRPSEPQWTKHDILKVYKGVMKYDEDDGKGGKN